MIRSLRTGVSGLKSNQTRMDVVGNNVSNVNTTAFKRSRAAFNEVLGQQLLGVGRSAGGSGINPSFVGLGVAVASIDQNWTQGALESTGVSTDLALNGDGFFIARSGDQKLLTRAGNFTFNRDGNLVTSNGLNVQGWSFNDKGVLVTGALQDVKINPGAQAPAQRTENIFIGGNLSADAKLGSQTTISTVVYDGQGEPHTVLVDFARSAKAGVQGSTQDTWRFSVRNASGKLLGATGTTPASAGGTASVGASGSGSAVEHSGAFTGAVDNNYAFQVTSGGEIGKDKISLSYVDSNGQKGQITVPANYIAGTPITVREGIELTFDVGTSIKAGESFRLEGNAGAGTLGVGANALSTPTTSGTYKGLLDNNYRFMVEKGGTVPSATEMKLRWYDDFGNSGTMNVPAGYDGSYDLEGPEGIMLNFGNGNTLDFGQFFETTVTGVGSDISFDANGKLITSAADRDEMFEFEWDIDGDGVLDAFNFNFGGGAHDAVTQSAGSTTTNVRDQDGHSSGTLTGFSINPEGVLQLNFTNGEQQKLFQLAIGHVNNPNGLDQQGENFYTTGAASGELQLGQAGRDFRTAVVAGTLEMSNVDLAAEFTEMIVAQRGYQAAARVITTSDELLQETVQLKR